MEQHDGAAQQAHQPSEFSPDSTSSTIATTSFWCLEMAVRPRSWIRIARGFAVDTDSVINSKQSYLEQPKMYTLNVIRRIVKETKHTQGVQSLLNFLQ